MTQNKLWWHGNPSERYWLESTDRSDIGVNLKAPVSDASGRSNWRYNLFCEAEIDDIVYHYDVRQSAITSWSRVAGLPEEMSIVWAARGSYAKKRNAVAAQVPGYVIPLDMHSILRRDLALNDLRNKSSQIKAITTNLSADPAQARYFPFELSDRRPLRLLQGYAFKLPADFVAAFPQLLDPRPPAMLTETEWTDPELAICVEAYAELLDRQIAGESINGSAATREIQKRISTRSEGAVIRRMQSISTILEQRGVASLRRFAAREQVGRGMELRIGNLLDEIRSTADPDELDRRTRRARTRLRGQGATAPAGSLQVRTTREMVVRCQRRADVRAWVFHIAGDTCEGCGQKAPFTTDQDEPYLEVHHVRPLMQGGPDTPDNAIAICPTCHRRLHFSRERMTFRAEILRRIARLVDHPEKAQLTPECQLAAD